MKVLILGAFNAGALENYYLRGLRLIGANCKTFDITKDYYDAISKSLINKGINKIAPAFFFERINRKLLEFAGAEEFDVIIIFKGLTLYPATVEALKKNTKLICCYNPDHPFKFFSPGSGNKNILDSIKHYDIYFTYANNICEQLKQDWLVNSYAIPFGYDDSEVYHSGSVNKIYNNKWLFIGTHDRERSKWLSELKVEGLNIYGDSKWASRSKANSYVAQAYQGRALYGDEYKMANRNAAGIINLLRKQNIEEQSHNMRTFEAPGYGGLLIANRTEEQQFFFEEDKEAVFFENVEELREKLNFLANNENIVHKMKDAAITRSQKSGYGYTERSSQLYKILQKHL